MGPAIAVILSVQWFQDRERVPVPRAQVLEALARPSLVGFPHGWRLGDAEIYLRDGDPVESVGIGYPGPDPELWDLVHGLLAIPFGVLTGPEYPLVVASTKTADLLPPDMLEASGPAVWVQSGAELTEVIASHLRSLDF